MNTDIRIKTSFPNHPKTNKLINMVGPLGPWQLVKLWIFAAQNKPEGILTNMTKSDICQAMGYKGNPTPMLRALRECGFLDKHESGNFELHDWKIHNSYAFWSKQRTERAKRGAKARWDKQTKQLLNGCSEQEQALLLAQDSNAPAPVPSPVPSPIEGAVDISIKRNGSGQSVDAMGRTLKVFA